MPRLDAGREPEAVTEDLFLGGRLRLSQPRTGARAGADAVFLAAATPARAGERVVELGSGSGAAMLCLAARVPEAEVLGIEIEPELAELARRNAAKNGFATTVSVQTGDIADLFADFPQASFNHVLANPPFFEAGRVAPPTEAKRRRARVATGRDLDLWLRFAAHVLRPRGSLTVIWRAERLPALLAGLPGRFGGISVFPLWPRAGRAAKLVIVQGRKGARAPFRLLPGLVLHGEGTAYTAAATAILRDGAALDIEAAAERKPKPPRQITGKAESLAKPIAPSPAGRRLATSL